MSENVLLEIYPQLMIYSVEHAEPGNVALCRAYAKNDTLVRTGVFNYVLSSDSGERFPADIEFRDRAMLRFPGESDNRREVIDRVMQTRFAAIHAPANRDFSVPCLASQSGTQVDIFQGEIELRSRRLADDPGYSAAQDEAKWIEFLTGKSDIANLTSEIEVIEFQPDDVVPVVVVIEAEETFGIVTLHQDLGHGRFRCTLSVESGSSICELSSFNAFRVVYAKQLNEQTGDMEYQMYSNRFGQLRIDNKRCENQTTEAIN